MPMSSAGSTDTNSSTSNQDSKPGLPRRLKFGYWTDHPLWPSLIGALVATMLASIPMLYQRAYGTPAEHGFFGGLANHFSVVVVVWVIFVFAGTSLIGYSQLKSANIQSASVAESVTTSAVKLTTKLDNAQNDLTSLQKGNKDNLKKLGTISGQVTVASRAVDGLSNSLEGIADNTSNISSYAETMSKGTSEVLILNRLGVIIRMVRWTVERVLSEPLQQGSVPESLRGSPYFIYLITSKAGRRLIPFYLEYHSLIAAGTLGNSEDDNTLDLLRIRESQATGGDYAWDLDDRGAARLPSELRNLKEGVTLSVTRDGIRTGVLVVARWKTLPLFFADGRETELFDSATNCAKNAAEEIADLLGDARDLVQKG